MKNIEQLIVEKSFHELDSNERAFVKELASNEAEFNHIKMLLSNVEMLKNQPMEQVSDKTKQSLDSIFETKHPSIVALNPQTTVNQHNTIPFFKQNWFRAASIILLFSGIFSIWYISEHKEFKSKTLVANIPTETSRGTDNLVKESTQDAASQPVSTLSSNNQTLLAEAESAIQTISFDESLQDQIVSKTAESTTLESLALGRSADLNPNFALNESATDGLNETPTNLDFLCLIEASY